MASTPFYDRVKTECIYDFHKERGAYTNFVTTKNKKQVEVTIGT